MCCARTMRAAAAHGIHCRILSACTRRWKWTRAVAGANTRPQISKHDRLPPVCITRDTCRQHHVGQRPRPRIQSRSVHLRPPPSHSAFSRFCPRNRGARNLFRAAPGAAVDTSIIRRMRVHTRMFAFNCSVVLRPPDICSCLAVEVFK